METLKTILLFQKTETLKKFLYYRKQNWELKM